jgi:virginiamycin B lyase
VRICGAVVSVLLVVLVGNASGAQQASPRGAKEHLASARQLGERALGQVLRPSLPTARSLLRALHAELAAALDTLGAAELSPTTTAAIRSRIVAAVRAERRALAELVSGSASAPAAAAAVRGALAAEVKAAALLANAPGRPVLSGVAIPSSVFGAFTLILGPDGRSVWVSGTDASQVLRYRSLAPGTKPTVFSFDEGSGPRGLAFGRDGALYVAETGTDRGGNKIARIRPNGKIREFPLPTGAGAPWGIAVGADRRIWFSEESSGKVGRLDPRTGRIVEYPLPTPHSQPQGIVLGPDGAIWGVEAGANKVFRITTAGRVREYPVPTANSVPVAITAGRNGNLWVSELEGGKLLRISREGRMREFPLPRGARPYGLVSAPDGNVWFADRGRSRIGLITPAGRVFEYTLSTPNAQPTAIVPLAHGSFAFTEFVGNRVGTLRFRQR